MKALAVMLALSILMPLVLADPYIQAPAGSEPTEIAAVYAEGGVAYKFSDFRTPFLPMIIPTSPSPPSSTVTSTTTLVEETVGLPTGTFTYLLTAADGLNNFALHDLYADITEGEPRITVTSPSPTGIGDHWMIDLRVNTSEAASCEWGYYSPTADMNNLWPMEGSGGLLHNATGLRDLTIEEGEIVPVMVECTASGSTSRRLIPVGWDKREHNIVAQRRPSRVGESSTPIAVYAHTQSGEEKTLSRCTMERVGGTSKARSGFLHDHVLRGVSAGSQLNTEHRVRCTDAKGEPLTEYPIITPSFQTGAIGLDVVSPQPLVRNRTGTIIIRSSMPAVCRAQLGEKTSRLGGLENYYQHQMKYQIATDQDTFQLPVTCNALTIVYEDGVPRVIENTDVTESVTISTTLDDDAPIAQVVDASYCPSEQAIITLGNRPSDGSHVIISSGGTTVVREWPENGILQQHGLNPSPGANVFASGVDRLGNVAPATGAEFEQRSDCVPVVENSIELMTPTGGASENDFTFRVRTRHQSACEYTVDSQTGTLEASSDKLRHSRQDFQQVLGAPGEYTVDVECVNGTDNRTESFTIAWNAEYPEYTLIDADPQTVTDNSVGTSQLTVETDQETDCTITPHGKDPFIDHNYQTSRTREIHVPYSSSEVEVSISCANRLGLTVNETVTIQQDYQPLIRIASIDAPELTRQSSITAVVRTTHLALCELDGTTSTSGHTHTFNPSLSQGPNTLSVTCRETSQPDRTATAEHITILDTTNPTINQTTLGYTCGLTKMSIRGTASDANGIAEYKVTINGTTYTLSSIPETIEGLDLIANASYMVNLTVVDNAGNQNSHTKEVEAKTRNEGSCDDTLPEARMYAGEDTNEGQEVVVYCRDGESGCDTKYELSMGVDDAACDYQEEAFPNASTPGEWSRDSHMITNLTQFCLRVYDQSQNTAQLTKSFSWVPKPDHCYDDSISGDEAGVDCGGSCAACGDNSTCTQDSHCASGICSDGVCEANSCENGIQDSDETDVDCGGTACGTTCEVDESCESPLDCVSNVCFQGTCQQPSCDDGRQNQGETGRDCGGPNCEACQQASECMTGTDCASGICSNGVCTDRELDDRPPDDEYPIDELDNPDDGGILGLLIIILGVLMAGGGGGYIWYEQQAGTGAAATSTAATSTLSSPAPRAEPKPKEPEEDYASSALREKARKERRSKRQGSRSELLGSFEDEKHAKKTEEKAEKKPAVDAVSQQNEKVHKRMSKAQTPEAIKELASSLLESGDAKKHEVSSALADLRAHEKLDDDALEDLRKDLDL